MIKSNKAAAAARIAGGASVAVLGFNTDKPDGYGRLVEENGKLVRIREHFEASEDERKITLCNGGIMAFNGAQALDLVACDKGLQRYGRTPGAGGGCQGSG